MPLTLIAKSEATKLVNTAKTIAVVRLSSAADLAALVKTLKEQLPASVLLVK